MPCNCGTLLRTRYNSTFYVFNWKLYLFDKTTVKDFGEKQLYIFAVTTSVIIPRRCACETAEENLAIPKGVNGKNQEWPVLAR